jgi:hypothetical protein
MTIADHKPIRTSPLVARVKAILLSPNAEWDVIEHEPATTGSLYTGYAIPLAAIAPICGAIGAIVFGYGGFGFSFHPSIVFVLTGAIVRFVLSLVSIFILALIIDALAPTFSGQKNQIQALKVAVYSSTASYVAGVFAIFPPLAILSILGLYSLYLMYCGLPKLMKSPADKSLAYTAVVVVCAIVLFIIIGAVTAPLAMMGAGSGFSPGRVGAATGTVALPGGGSVDMSKLQALAQSATQSTVSSGASAGAASGAGAATVVPVSTDALKGLLPASIDGYERTEISSASGTAGPIAGANAKATYTKGSSSIELSVVDMAVLGGLAKAFNVQSDSETATGYEKVGQVDGRLTTEKYDRQSKDGSFSVMAGSRFLVQADGTHVDMATLKDAIAMVGPQRLDALATAH